VDNYREDECIPALLEIWKCSSSRFGLQIVDFSLEFVNYTHGNMISISESYAESIENSTDWYTCMYNPVSFIMDIWYSSGSITGMAPNNYFTLANKILERAVNDGLIDWSRRDQILEVDIADYVAEKHQMPDSTNPVVDRKYRSGRTFRGAR
jgi:hypothetical protein